MAALTIPRPAVQVVAMKPETMAGIDVFAHTGRQVHAPVRRVRQGLHPPRGWHTLLPSDYRR